jgi:hypothetical protein
LTAQKVLRRKYHRAPAGLRCRGKLPHENRDQSRIDTHTLEIGVFLEHHPTTGIRTTPLEKSLIEKIGAKATMQSENIRGYVAV